MTKVMRKEARHTQRRDRASGVPLEILEHIPPKPESAYFLLVLSPKPLTLRGALPHYLSLRKELAYSSSKLCLKCNCLCFTSISRNIDHKNCLWSCLQVKMCRLPLSRKHPSKLAHTRSKNKLYLTTILYISRYIQGDRDKRCIRKCLPNVL